MRTLIRLLVVAALIAPQAALALDPGKVPPITLGTGTSGDASAVNVTPSASAPPGTLARSLSDQASSLAAKAPLASPIFTGAPSMPAVTLTGPGSTGDVSGMSVTPDASKSLGTLARFVADRTASYDAALAQIQAKRAGGTRWSQTATGLVDAFQDQSGIATGPGGSALYVYDSRKLLATSRAYAMNIGRDGFEGDLSGWTTVVGATIVDTHDPDPPTGKSVQLATSTSVGNQAVLSRDFGTIPGSFGVMAMVRLPAVGTNPADALEMQVANVNGHILRVRFFNNGIQLFANGGWQNLYPYGGDFVTEHWFEVTWNGGSNYSVRHFMGTQEYPGFTGNLPSGGTDGVVTFIQNSGATASRIGQVAEVQIGTSTVPADMSFVSIPRSSAAAPARGWVALLVEDVCLGTVMGTDLTASLSRNGGATWEPVALTNIATVGVGIIDATKPLYLVVGNVNFAATPDTGNTVKLLVNSHNGRYFDLHGYAWGTY